MSKKIFLPSKDIVRVPSPGLQSHAIKNWNFLPRIRKYRETIIGKCAPLIAGAVGIGGFYRLEILKSDGRSYWATPWFHNHITDAGLDMIATEDGRFRFCQVGSGTAAPQDTDTALQSYVASCDTGQSGRYTSMGNEYNNSTPPYWAQDYVRYNFPAGAVVGNISEVGIGPNSGSGSTLFSRELIRDAAGDPTTISVQSDELLRVHHKTRGYAPTGDQVGSITADLEGAPVVLNYTRRAASAGGSQWLQRNGYPYDVSSVFSLSSSRNLYLYDGNIGTELGSPGGTEFLGNGSTRSWTHDAYSPGSHTRTATMRRGVPQPNGQTYTGIRSMYLTPGQSHPVLGAYQVEFDQPFDKGQFSELYVDIRWSWGRYTP